jgi:hypothetical protein
MTSEERANKAKKDIELTRQDIRAQSQHQSGVLIELEDMVRQQ